MKLRPLSMLIGTIILSSHVFSAEIKPKVEIYATGGTIAGVSDSKTDTTNYKAGSLGIESLIQAVPELKDVATVSGQQVVNVDSSDIDQETLLKLSKLINKKLLDPSVHGAVITHGTDTMEETAFFLDLTIHSTKPVVVVGSMRPATAISADGPMNLLEAVSLAANKNAENRGTMVVLNDRISSAFYVTKTNATTLDTFKAVEQGYLGTFIGTLPKFYFQPAQPVNKPSFDIAKIESLPKVEIIYMYQNQDTSMIDAAVRNGAKGIVIAGTGNGSFPTRFKEKVKSLMDQGIPVVRATRTGSGYVSEKEEGIGSGYFNPQKSRILLSLALAEHANMSKIKDYFSQ